MTKKGLTISIIALLIAGGLAAFLFSNTRQSLPQGFNSYLYPGTGIEVGYPSNWMYRYRKGFTGINAPLLFTPSDAEQVTVEVRSYPVPKDEDWIKSASYTNNCGELDGLVERKVADFNGKEVLVQKESEDFVSASSPCSKMFAPDGFYRETIAIPFARGNRYVTVDLQVSTEQKDVFLPIFHQMVEHTYAPKRVSAKWQAYSDADQGIAFSHPPETTVIKEDDGDSMSIRGYQMNTVIRIYQLNGMSLEAFLEDSYSLRHPETAEVNGYRSATGTVHNVDCEDTVKALADREKVVVFYLQCTDSMSDEEFSERYSDELRVFNSVEFI